MPNVYNWLDETIGEHSFEESGQICTYIWNARYNDKELKFDVTDEHFKWCQVTFEQQITYGHYYATPEFWYLLAKQELTLLDELVDVVFDGAVPGKESIIAENLYVEGSMYSEG